MNKLSAYERATFAMLTEFDLAAQSWGYTQDQGTGAAVNAAEDDHIETYRALLGRIKQLHAARRSMKRLRLEVKRLKATLALDD